jgi:hypothetical protein
LLFEQILESVMSFMPVRDSLLVSAVQTRARVAVKSEAFAAWENFAREQAQSKNQADALAAKQLVRFHIFICLSMPLLDAYLLFN